MSAACGTSWQLRAYLALRPLLSPLMRAVLWRRLQRGKEDPARIGERLGQTSLARPQGRLVWLHAVGLGEVLALRPLIAAMQTLEPELNMLITSTAQSSARVIGANLPPRTVHQFLPIDGPRFVKSFLDHWRPDLSVWSEQDLWPGAICDAAARGIPLAYVNARINADSHAKRARIGGLYGDVLRRFALISAQDGESAQHLSNLGAPEVQILGSLKPAAEPLGADPEALATLRVALAGRKVWVAASTHELDEEVVIAAQERLMADDPAHFLILTPRAPDRAPRIVAAVRRAGISFAQRSRNEMPGPETQVLLADSYGELGLWYRLAGHAFIGASFGGLGGHNPWEAICIGVPVLSGPDTANFRTDYDELFAAGLAQRIEPGEGADADLARAIRSGSPDGAQERAKSLVEAARAAIKPLARDLVSLIGSKP